MRLHSEGVVSLMRLRMTQAVLAGEGDGRIASVGYVSLPAPLRLPLAEAIVNDAKSADSIEKEVISSEVMKGRCFT
jgi:hypothetical protein